MNQENTAFRLTDSTAHQYKPGILIFALQVLYTAQNFAVSSQTEKVICGMLINVVSPVVSVCYFVRFETQFSL